MSALSSNGLDFAREDGVRLDKLCPPESVPGLTPIIDALGNFHTVVQTPEGLRVYFILYNAGQVIPETALYSVINTSIK